MSKFPDEMIEKIKRDISLKNLIESDGVKLEPRGKDLAGLCPYHDDHEPSLLVTPEKNLWHCLGACQTGGSVIDWVMKMEKVSFRHAVDILKERFQIASSGSAPDKPTPDADIMFSADVDKQQLLNHVIEFYHKTLKDSPSALGYFEKRKLIEPSMIDYFKLGYANRTLGYRLPKNGQHAVELRSKLQEMGLFRSTGHENFSGSVIIPVIDEAGQVTEVYGRKITRGLRPGTSLHLYLKGQHKGVFNVQAFEASKEIILCEALIDALTFWCHGFRNVTSSYGVNGFTNDHLAAFKKYHVHTVMIAYDNDEAGNRAADRLSLKLTGEGFYCKRIRFPWGMDANQFACESDNPARDFEQLIQSASGINEGREAGEEQRQVQKPSARAPLLPSANVCSQALCQSDSSLPTEIKRNETIITLGDRKWRIRGLVKNMSYEHLKVNILVSIKEKFFIDTLDLYSANLRSTFCKRAAAEIEASEDVVKNDLCKVFLKLEELQDQQIKEALEPQKHEVILSEKEKEEALAFLKDPDLLKRILSDIERCGVIGEQSNKLVCYLAAVSRKLENPLAVIIQSSSAAGKTWLMDNILNFMPEEDRVKYSAMTGQSLYYLGDKDLKHKILAIVEEEGAEKASYALKILQSEKELCIASTGKDPSTGKLVTHEYRVEGPVMIFITTTSIDIDEELQNRCLVLSVNESREQTRAIHKLQRERRTLSGLQAKQEKSSILKLHNNAQRLLRPLAVVNPYAPKLTFLDDRTRTRRDHEKYLNLIDAVALLHQYQRPVKRIAGDGSDGGGESGDYIEVQLSDIEVANKLAGEVLGRSLEELPPQTRQLLMIIERFVVESCLRHKIERSDFRFSRRQIREYCGWGNTQLKLHFSRLEDLEYLIVYRGSKGRLFDYELLYNGQGKDGKPFMVGLLDAAKLRALKKTGYDDRWSGEKSRKSPQGRAEVGGESAGGRGDVLTSLASNENCLEAAKGKTGENPYIPPAQEETPNRKQTENYHSLLAAKVKKFEETADKREKEIENKDFILKDQPVLPSRLTGHDLHPGGNGRE